MKTFLSLGIALLAFAPAQAQIFRSEAVNGAVLGGIAGGIIGHNSGDLRNNGWKGAAIGATAGLLIGQAIGDARDRDYGYGRGGGYVYRNSPSVRVGVGYHSGYSRGWGYPRYGWNGHRGVSWGISYGPSYGYYRGYGWGYPRIGYSAYDVDTVYQTPSVPVVVQQPQVVQAPVQQQQPAPQQVTIINNYYGNTTPMSSANALFGR